MNGWNLDGNNNPPLESGDEGHANPQIGNDLIQLAIDRKDVEDIWTAAISTVAPEYTKRLTRKELSRLCYSRKMAGAQLFQRIVLSVVRRWDQWVLEDDKGAPCTADPGRPPVRYLIRFAEVAACEFKDRENVSDEKIEAMMDWLNGQPGSKYPL
jgi:hypothetical protein